MYRARFFHPSVYLISMLILGVASADAQVTSPGSKAASATRPHPVTEIKMLLQDRGYWITKIDTIRNAEYTSAVSAFRKVEGLKHAKSFDDAQLARLRLSVRPKPSKANLIYAQHDTERAHIEVDLKRQVLFWVDSLGVVQHVLPVSTGNGEMFSTKLPDGSEWRRKAVTPAGQFRITRKITGWRKSDLGMLYFPLYFRGGAAVHGAQSVPNKPASHGCIRVPIFAAERLSSITPVGHPILIY